MKRLTKSEMIAACNTCCESAACPFEVRCICECLKKCLTKTVECHALVHACRDIASRCACEACVSSKKGWKECCRCCFSLCDACDSYCHQRCSLPQMLEMRRREECDMVCAFKEGPKIPGTKDYVPPAKINKFCCVYCANSACGAERSYCDQIKSSVKHLAYPGGLLEYHCRSKIDASLSPLKAFDPTHYKHRHCKQECVP